MTKPGFRKGRSGRAHGGGAGDAHDAFVSGALFSQAQIMQLMKNEFARARRHGFPLGCLLLQVDRLANLVDLYGAGLRQAVRTAIAGLVRERTRDPDLLGVSSDDRYLVILPHTDIEQARVVADRLRSAFAGLSIEVDGRELDLSISLGISASADGETMFFDTLVAQAEAALDYATQQGGNVVVSFGEARLRGGEADPPGIVDPGVAEGGFGEGGEDRRG
ncbi:MAG: GGDEF domain-containing protein [Planctomycetes bacterium]|nr:GGDEF domain-containing protein [Planctomycetota bacterium]